MYGEFFVADLINLNPYPAAHAHLGRSIKFLRRFLNQHPLNSDRRRHGDRNVPVVVMIV